MICSYSVATKRRSTCPDHGQSAGPVGKLGSTRGRGQQGHEGKSEKSTLTSELLSISRAVIDSLKIYTFYLPV